MMSGRIKHHAGAYNVGMNEVLRGINTPINVRFRCEIYHRIKMMLMHQRIHLLAIGDVRMEKLVTLPKFLLKTRQILRVPRIGQYIDIGN